MIQTESRPQEQKTALKFMKRAGIYKGNNVSFNPETKIALSYSWWEFVKVIGGKVFFNSYRYSVSTGKHQSKLRQLLRELEITVDFDVEAPQGLQNPLGSIEYMENQVKALHALNQKGRPSSWAYTNRARNIQEFSAGIIALKACLEIEGAKEN